MELKLHIGYQDLLELIRQLPKEQIERLRTDLTLMQPERQAEKDILPFTQWLQHGPVMDDEQYQNFLDNRAYFSAWRIH